MNKNKIRVITCGITLGSLVFSAFAQRNQQTIAAPSETGSLTFVANGEDFVRQGFVSKDGWKINFDRLYINLGSAIAYSTEAAYEPQKGDTKESIQYQDKVEFLDRDTTSDLAQGETNAEPIAVAEATVPVGFYNALAWKLTTADSNSPIPGKTMALLGQATKDGQTIDFDLSFNRPTEYVCGEFIGEARQGIVVADTPGKIEATFHFDHVFGDADTPPEDALNQDALGFQPIAALANNNAVKLDDTELATQLTSEDYQQLTDAIAGLGHVGEGHCVITNSQ